MNQPLNIMDQSYRRASYGLPKAVKLRNHKEDVALQHELKRLDVQYRYTLKMLQQRRDSLLLEHRRVLLLRVCEPKATINKNMKEIAKRKDEIDFRDIHTSDGRRLNRNREPELLAQRRTISAPPPASVKPVGSAGNTGLWSLSLMQLKNIATIDSISKKELASQQQHAREERERLKRFQREAMHQRVKAFTEKLNNDSSKMELLVQSP